MLSMVVISGFLLGFLGSMHCVGMCGPIMLALPFKSKSPYRFIVKRVLYHTGRIMVYTTFGLLVGLLGDRLNFTGIQHVLTISAGFALLVFGVLSIFKVNVLAKFSFLERPYIFAKKFLGKYIIGDGLASGFLLGVLNGFLPCGFVYVALAGALAYANVFYSPLFMILFGLGTMPALILVSVLPRIMSKRVAFNSQRLIPIFTIVFAVLIILRGLNLGIPFLSPNINNKLAIKKPVVEKIQDTKPVQKAEAVETEKDDCCK
jgi:sulfite exporter TauE/SafE